MTRIAHRRIVRRRESANRKPREQHLKNRIPDRTAKDLFHAAPTSCWCFSRLTGIQPSRAQALAGYLISLPLNRCSIPITAVAKERSCLQTLRAVVGASKWKTRRKSHAKQERWVILPSDLLIKLRIKGEGGFCGREVFTTTASKLNQIKCHIPMKTEEQIKELMDCFTMVMLGHVNDHEAEIANFCLRTLSWVIGQEDTHTRKHFSKMLAQLKKMERERQSLAE